MKSKQLLKSSINSASLEYDNNRAKDFTFYAAEKRYICFVLPISMYTPNPLRAPLNMDKVNIVRDNGKISQLAFDIFDWNSREHIVYHFKYWD